MNCRLRGSGLPCPRRVRPSTSSSTRSEASTPRFLESIDDEQTALEGLKWMFTILQIGLDVYVLGDDQNPQFVDIAGPGSNKSYARPQGSKSSRSSRVYPVKTDSTV